ncbi:hypothetical protein RO21_01180 [[Actinobacillus] muris]|uniref:RiboL-PSP-HEPN domain-containing protein n=1 Tax=Muribacter muris TaxID=67855 RepID=A0A0J5P9J3_9PAST|nr:hypothetical protein [Muribacter muris]KMK52385.1 hypothetical protein RO21_01180 [[Actinobacillus] muris] [Muribacter muris]
MNIDTFESYINEQNEWAQEKDCYDIAIFRCWIKFEKFLIYKFVEYSTKPFGSEDIRRLKFDDESHFKAFLKGERSYIEYMSKIEKLSQHIFKNNKNPFEILISDQNYSNVFKDLVAIRNYIAHESEEAERKYINRIFSSNPKRMIPVNDYLKSWKDRKKAESCYSFYVRGIKEMSKLIELPIF